MCNVALKIIEVIISGTIKRTERDVACLLVDKMMSQNFVKIFYKLPYDFYINLLKICSSELCWNLE